VPNSIDEKQEKQSGVSLSIVITRVIWICMLPLFLFAALISSHEVIEVHREQARQASSLAENIISSTDNALKARIHALNILANSPLVDDRDRWAELYKVAQGFYRSFGKHVVISDGGTPTQLLLNTRVPYGTKLPIVKQPNGRLAGPIAIRTGNPAVSDLFEGPVAHEPLVGIAVPVLRKDKAQYAILTTLDKAFFQENLNQMAIPITWVVALKDAQGGTIAIRLPSPIQHSAASFVAESQVSGWKVTVEIGKAARWQPLVSTFVLLGGLLLGVTLAGFWGGKWAGRRLGRAVASLTNSIEPGTPPHRIQEIEAARRLLHDETHKRTAAENILRESEEFLREKMLEYSAIFERSAVGKAQADPVTGRFLKVNQAFADMLGYSPAELCQMTFMELTHPDDRERTGQGFEAVRAGADQFKMDNRYLKKDGTVIWVHVSGNLIRFDDGRPARTIAIIQDITDRKAAEEALRESEEQFRVLTHNLVSAVALIDEHGEICIVNRAFLSLFDLPEDADILNINSRDWSQWQVFDNIGRLLDVEEHPIRKAARTRSAIKDVLVGLESGLR
jgi:two-component system, sensor histidine kinase and response regulator